MMLSNVFTKAVRDRWTGVAVGAVLAGLMLVATMASYQQVDTSLYTDLPEAMRAVMGIPEAADPATLSYGVGLGLVASLTLAGLAISMGASAVAGEERDGTMGVLLGNPRSRRAVVVAKTGAMLGLVALGTLVVLAASWLAPALLDVQLGGTELLAANVHLLLNAWLWGALALAIGSATGNRALASGAATGAMVVSYFLTGLLPLSAGLADVARVLPWWWFDGHDPLTEGLAVGWAALQIAATVALLAVAWWAVAVRDLRRGAATAGPVAALVERVRGDERFAAVLDRLGGSASVRSIWLRAASEGRALLVVASLVMLGVLGLLMGPMYAALEDTLVTAGDSLPETLLLAFGGGDISTPEGWYRLETFALMAPAAVALVAGAAGARALAGEERDRTMGLLLASPVPRRRVVLEKAAALALQAAVVAVSTFVGVLGGALLGGLDLSAANVAAACLHLWLLGVLFGGVALAVGAATGSVRAATLATVGVFAAGYVGNALLAIAGLDEWTVLSPFDWYLGHEPLRTGVDLGSAGLLVTTTLVLLATAAWTFDHRDLRRT